MMDPFHTSGKSTGHGRGFTLIELLIVIALVAIMAVASVPALASLNSSGNMNQTLSELSALLEQARQYAVANNTPVWVAFYQNPGAAEGGELSVSILASKDGTDPAPWSNYGRVPNNNIELVRKVRTYRQIKLSEAGAFTSSQVPSLPSNVSIGPANRLAETATFAIQLPQQSGAAEFSRVVEFTPSGEARNSASPIDLLEFALQPQKGRSAPVADNVAVLRINGLTGQTSIYRR